MFVRCKMKSIFGVFNFVTKMIELLHTRLRLRKYAEQKFEKIRINKF
jgi:hypothetical protein